MKILSHRMIVVAIAMACLWASSSAKTITGNLNVVPQPMSVEQDLEAAPFVVNKNTTIVCPEGNATMQRNAEFLAKYIAQSTGITPRITSEKKQKNAIVLAVDGSIGNREGYTLKSGNNGVTIKGGSEVGVFYGIQTLYKSLPVTVGSGNNAALPDGEVVDMPRFPYRGFMLDVGRHFYPVKYVKEVIDMLAMHNINYFHWHLSEDQGWRIEIKKYPRLTEVGSTRKRTLIDQKTMTYDETPHSGFYTQEEAREVVAYAAERHITVIPEIDLPGHMMAALVAYPELGCTGGPYEMPCRWGVFDDVLCGGNEATLQFAKDVLSEIMDIFPSPYIHIGGDECPKKHWKTCPKCQAKIKELGLVDTKEHSKENQLQTYFMGEVGKLINSRGRKMMGWDEMLEGGLAPGATVMSWTSPKPAVKTAKLHHDVIVTPIQYLYFSNPYHNGRKGIKSLQRVYNFEPMPSELAEAEKKYVIGTQGCLWTEWTRDTVKVEWQILPRMAALSELQWAQPDKKDFNSFLERLTPMLRLYDNCGYGYRKDLHDVYVQCFKCQYEGRSRVELTTLAGEIFYTLDGSEPNRQSMRYYGNIVVNNGVTLKAVAYRPDGTTTPVATEVIGTTVWTE